MFTKRLSLALSLVGLTLSGCTTSPTTYPYFVAAPVAQKTSSASFTQTADNLFVILDTSSSKAETFDGDVSNSTLLDVEKQLLHRISKTIPASANITSGLRSFGTGFCAHKKDTLLLQKANTQHSNNIFQSSLDKANSAHGDSHLERALQESTSDLKATTGNIALLVITDGQKISSKVLAEASALEAQYGDRLCIYSVWVGNQKEQAGKLALQELSNIAGCGRSVDIQSVMSNIETAAFVEEMLYKETPKAIIKCNTSISDTQKNDITSQAFPAVPFNNDKASVASRYARLFDNTIETLKSHPHLHLEIQGHTDNTGSAYYNSVLSFKRAENVKNILVSNGISTDRLTIKSFGESAPLASNDTEEGRASNRCVELKPSFD
jgi:OOP family OmpA-OmpF porin